jgi:hypothetical protein
VNTHYAVISFSGDPGAEHPDPELRGLGPSLAFVAVGPEDFCWDALGRWTAKHPLRMWEEAEVLQRDPAVVRRLSDRGVP